MPYRKLRPRVRYQGIDFVVACLKDLMRDKKVAPRTRLEACDRLAVIDRIYAAEKFRTSKVYGDNSSDIPVAAEEAKADAEVEHRLSEFLASKKKGEENESA